MSRAATYASYLLLAVLGVAVGAAGALVQGALFPGGLILALAGSAALFHGGATLTGGKPGAAIPTATWFLTVMFLSISRPEGDFLFTAGVGPYVYLLGGMAVGVFSSTWNRSRPIAR